MKNMFFLFFALLFNMSIYSQIDKDLLVTVHTVATTIEMNDIVNPKIGDYVFNSESNATYVYNGGNWVTGGFIHTPYLTVDSAIEINANTTATILITGTDFTLSTEISVPGLTVNNFTVLSPTQIEVNLTTGNSGYYDVIVNNGNKFNTDWTNNEKDKIHVL